MKLYEISAEICNAINNDDENLEEILFKFKDKASQILRYTLNLKADCAKIKTHCDELTEKRRRIENKISRIEAYVQNEMKNSNVKEIKDEEGLFIAQIALNPWAVEILDESEISVDFKTAQVVEKIDKKAILTHFKETGEIVKGVKIKRDERLQIK